MRVPIKSGVSTVMSRIKTFIEDENSQPPTFISVAGDNYYPNKPEKKTKKDKSAEKDKDEVKQKVIIQSELNSGFACLESLNVPVKVILGNHDLETNREKKHTFLIESQEAESCAILELENQVTKPSKHGVKLQLDFLTEGEIPFIGTNTLVLMIDTSMYETDADDIAQYEECYQKLEDDLFLSESLSKIEQIQNRQQFRVINAIKKYPNKTNIVVIGHHPITAYIIKKDEYKLVKPFSKFVELWKEIIENTAGKTRYYLCADKHFYQPGTVTIYGTPIHQYIVGTGGAELDTNPFTNPLAEKQIRIKNMKADNNVTYSMVSRQIWDSYSNYGYGFLTCTENDKQLTFEFIQTNATPEISRELEHKKDYALSRDKILRERRPQSAPTRRGSSGLSRSRSTASAGGKKPRTRKLYRRKRK